MSVLFGPAEALGHPFQRVANEVPFERRVGRHTAYAWALPWLYSGPEIEPDDPQAVVVWDPGWLRNGTAGGAIDELGKLRRVADEWDVPMFGVASDWFATWANWDGMHGMGGALSLLDGVVVDPVGAAALRAADKRFMFGPDDDRYRALVELSGFLSYGRLPTLGDGGEHAVPAPGERSIDVCMVSNLYPNLVVFRSYYVEAARRYCEERNLTFVSRAKVRAEEMEELYLDSRVVLNVSLGTQPNCRVYEALACGAALVTDGYNVGLPRDAPCHTFTDVPSLRRALTCALSYGATTQGAGLRWARDRAPWRQWERVFDAALDAPRMTNGARAERFERERRIAEVIESAPLTKDGRPVVLV